MSCLDVRGFLSEPTVAIINWNQLIISRLGFWFGYDIRCLIIFLSVDLKTTTLWFQKIVASGCERTGLFYFTLQIPVYKSAVVWEGSKFRHIVMDSKLAPFSCHLSFLPNSACYHEVGSVLCKCNRKINPTTLYVVFPKPRIITEGVFYSLNNVLFVICMDKNRW